MVLDRFHQLEGAGLRVRVRLARATDRIAVADLLRQLGLTADELDLRRALHFAPGLRWGVVATTWDGRHERLVGFGSVEDDRRTRVGLDREACSLLGRALDEHARTWRGRRVA